MCPISGLKSGHPGGGHTFPGIGGSLREPGFVPWFGVCLMLNWGNDLRFYMVVANNTCHVSYEALCRCRCQGLVHTPEQTCIRMTRNPGSRDEITGLTFTNRACHAVQKDFGILNPNFRSRVNPKSAANCSAQHGQLSRSWPCFMTSKQDNTIYTNSIGGKKLEGSRQLPSK